MGLIVMQHPETGGQSEVPEDTFEEVWEPLGWKRAQYNEEDGTLIPVEKPEETTADTGDANASGEEAPEAPKAEGAPDPGDQQ